MRFVETGLAGAWLIEPEPIADARGLFARTFCEREFAPVEALASPRWALCIRRQKPK